MPKHVRRRIFYSLIVLFILLGTAAVLYAQGWRTTREEGRVQLSKVGAIYLRTFPENATVILDGKSKKRNSGLFDKGTLFGNLLPGNHDLIVQSPGFQEWEMPTMVTSSIVTALRYVTLVPAGAVAATSTEIQEFYLAGENIVLDSENGLVTLAGQSLRGDEFLAYSPGNDLLLTQNATGTPAYIATRLSASTSTNIALPSSSEGRSSKNPTKLDFEPVTGSSGFFLVKSSSTLEVFNSNTASVTSLATTTVSATNTNLGQIAWSIFDPETKVSFVSLYAPESNQLKSSLESLPGKVIDIETSSLSAFLALTEDGSLYSVDLNQANRSRIKQGVKKIFLADNGKHLAILTAQGLEVLFLQGERLSQAFPIPEPDLVREISWYRDNEHVFLMYPNKTLFLGLEDSGLHNLKTAAPSGNAKYSQESNTLFFMQEDLLHSIPFPGS